MSKKLIIRKEARDETIHSYLWYEEQQTGLGEYFLKNLEKCYDEITKRPESYQKKYNDIRHALLSKFPFVVFFEMLEERIVIYSVFHSSREPLSWKK